MPTASYIGSQGLGRWGSRDPIWERVGPNLYAYVRNDAPNMIDPFGDDVEDLSVILYVESTLEISSTIMNSKNRMAKLGSIEEK